MKDKIATFKNSEFQRKLWNLALPIAFQSLLYSLLGLIDILMVSQLGEHEIAAVGLGNKIFFFNLLMLVGISQAGGILAAQFFGSGNMGEFRKTLVNSLIFSLSFSIPFIVFYTISPQSVTSFATEDPTLLMLSNEYLIITAGSLIFTSIVMPIETTLRSAGDTKTTMQISILVLPINAFLNYILIFGYLGFPEMGVAGSAWGTFIARAIQMLLIVWFFVYKQTNLLPSKSEIKDALRIFEMKRYFKLAYPMVLQDSSWALGVLVYTLLFSMIGIQELAIMSMVSIIEQLIFAIFIGIAIASGTMIGHELGAKALSNAWQQAWTFILFIPLLAFLFFPIIYFLREPILDLFPTLSMSSRSSASDVLLILASFLFIRVVNFIGLIGVLRSGGDLHYSTFIDVFSMWCIGIPLTFIAIKYYDFTLSQAYLVALSEEMIKMVLVILRIRKNVWIKNILR